MLEKVKIVRLGANVYFLGNITSRRSIDHNPVILDVAFELGALWASIA